MFVEQHSVHCKGEQGGIVQAGDLAVLSNKQDLKAPRAPNNWLRISRECAAAKRSHQPRPGEGPAPLIVEHAGYGKVYQAALMHPSIDHRRKTDHHRSRCPPMSRRPVRFPHSQRLLIAAQRTGPPKSNRVAAATSSKAPAPEVCGPMQCQSAHRPAKLTLVGPAQTNEADIDTLARAQMGGTFPPWRICPGTL